MPEPTPVSGGHVFVHIYAGGGLCHGETCGIAADGRSWCWGRHYQRGIGGLTPESGLYCWGETFERQLGDGSTGGVARPTPVLPGHEVWSVALGDAHICATIADRALCWGRDQDGQLGNPPNPFGWLFPVPVWTP